MDSFIVEGGNPLIGDVSVSGAKNVALKACVGALLTDQAIILHNVPNIRDVTYMLDILKGLGADVTDRAGSVTIANGNLKKISVDLETGARLRTAILVIGPLLARFGEAKIPNPGGCRIGARPIDRHMDGLKAMGVTINYNSDDGYFHAKAKSLHGATISLPKNTHTGTETLILAGVLAQGTTVLLNAAEEVEVDDLITLLNLMGAKISRQSGRKIVIEGVKTLHGAEYTIMPDRNEEITFALAAALTQGEITVHNSQLKYLRAFLDVFTQAGGKYIKINNDTTKYWVGKDIHPTSVTTGPYPEFMTDWQAPWAVFMTQANGVSSIHESVFESRFSYVTELNKMGAVIEYFEPEVKDPENFYNFNWSDKSKNSKQGIKIHGPNKLHNAILNISDLRAGATLVLAALKAQGKSYIHGVDQLDRGYELMEEKLIKLGAKIKRVIK